MAAERLWRFATSQYASEAVARACLRAQDELGMDVILMLYTVWLASEGLTLDAVALAEAEAACGPWREAVVLPLRVQRRQWKHAPARALEYNAIKQLELQAEKAQLEMLAGGCSPAAPASRPPAGVLTALLAANLRALCRHYGVADDGLDELQAALTPL